MFIELSCGDIHLENVDYISKFDFEEYYRIHFRGETELMGLRCTKEDRAKILSLANDVNATEKLGALLREEMARE
jgi:hypothetical protein